MKSKNAILLALSFMLSLIALSQAPNSFKYQSMIRKIDGSVLTDKSVKVKINILKGSPSGMSVYSEVHSTVSNAFGIVNLNIGEGIDKIDSISSIDWSADSYFVKIEMDETGGTNYTLISVSQLLSVPYALHANSAKSIDWTRVQNKPTLFSGNYNDLSNKPNLSDTSQYLKTEKEPAFSASIAKGIKSTDTTLWNKNSNFTLTSPNGSKFKIKVNNDGSLATDPYIDPGKIYSPWTIAGCVYRQNPSLPTDAELNTMASGKAVILDIELGSNEIVDKLNALNSDLLIGIYFNPMETFTQELSSIQWKNSIRNDLLNNYDTPASKKSFFVYNPSHDQKIVTTKGRDYSMWLMNLSNYCPTINNKKFNDYYSEKIIERLNPIISKIDFLLFDNGLRDIVWLGNSSYTNTENGLAPDIDWNNVNDCDQFASNKQCGTHNTAIDTSWRNGTLKILKNLKTAFPNIKIIVNQPNEFYYQACDGKQFENIGLNNVPGPTDWKTYGTALANPKEMLDVIINYFIENNLYYNLIQSSIGQGLAASSDIDETAMVMALLYNNSLFCFEHNSLRVPDIANSKIGKPKYDTKDENGLKIREYENGYVVFNTSLTTISYSGVDIPSFRGKIIMK